MFCLSFFFLHFAGKTGIPSQPNHVPTTHRFCSIAQSDQIEQFKSDGVSYIWHFMTLRSFEPFHTKSPHGTFTGGTIAHALLALDEAAFEKTHPYHRDPRRCAWLPYGGLAEDPGLLNMLLWHALPQRMRIALHLAVGKDTEAASFAESNRHVCKICSHIRNKRTMCPDTKRHRTCTGRPHPQVTICCLRARKLTSTQ